MTLTTVFIYLKCRPEVYVPADFKVLRCGGRGGFLPITIPTLEFRCFALDCGNYSNSFFVDSSHNIC